MVDMAGVKRPAARIVGAGRASDAASKAGREVKLSRQRRRMHQKTLAATVGISQARLAEIEAGSGAGSPPEVWFALAEALGRYLRFEFARDPQAELADAGHLQVQEIVLRVTASGGWEERTFESKSGSWGSDRSVDVRLLDRQGRRLVIGECWNTFGDLGAATRSSDRKVRDSQEHAVAIAGEGRQMQVGLVWIVRDTTANRAIVNRYEQIFATRFPGSSAAWINALTKAAPIPAGAGLIWCDTRNGRLFAHRRRQRPESR